MDWLRLDEYKFFQHEGLTLSSQWPQPSTDWSALSGVISLYVSSCITPITATRFLSGNKHLLLLLSIFASSMALLVFNFSLLPWVFYPKITALCWSLKSCCFCASNIELYSSFEYFFFYCFLPSKIQWTPLVFCF